MRRERECGGRESVEGERVRRERTDRKEGWVKERREKKTEWRMKVKACFSVFVFQQTLHAN